MKAKYTIILLSIFAVIVVSCKKFVDIEPAPNIIGTEMVFKSDKTAMSAISGLYVQLRANTLIFTNGGLSIYAGLAADEIYATSPTTTTDPFYLNSLIPTTSTVNTAFYAHSFRNIYHANSIIEALVQSKLITDSIRRQLTGEAKFVRSLLYFYLVNLFGEVPLITTTDYKLNAIKPRVSIQEVYAQIIQDLLEAQSLLKNNYPSAGKVRPNKWAATSLLSRVYLYLQEWQKAEEQASLVINSGQYSLLNPSGLGNAFQKNSPETIWEIGSVNEQAPVGEAVLFIPASTSVKPTYSLTNTLLAAFETGDRRRVTNGTGWVDSNKVSNVTYLYPKKYRQRTLPITNPPSTINEYEVVLRLPEMYLIRAEARAKQNNIGGSQVDLNKIRNRAGLPNTTANSNVTLLTAIEKENQVEFFVEWGHRWLDLKRTGRADMVLSLVKGSNWQSTDALWPIPQNEIIYNPSLHQNPGY